MIYIDNQGAIKLCKNPEYYKKTKHIFIKYHKTYKLVQNNLVIIKQNLIAKMMLDTLIKLLGVFKFRNFISMLVLVDF